MKTTVNANPCKKEPTFPCLMQSKITDNIVLFTSATEGTLISVGQNTNHALGQHKGDWWENNFKPFSGSICLENS